MNITVVGLQWGDEGKGKIVDWLAGHCDVIVRFQGGNNAGHTLVVDGATYKLSTIPSGILRPGKLNVIANGTVLDPQAFNQEITALRQGGIVISPENLAVALNTPLILSPHRELDRLREEAAGRMKIGTTLRGIGPAYEDKVGRRAVRLGDLADRAAIPALAERLLNHHNALRRGLGAEPIDHGKVCGELSDAALNLLPYGRPVWKLLKSQQELGNRILFEGAQGALLDIDHGTYPFVTSSSTVPGGVSAGAGIGPGCIGHVLGICKAYSTRVGAGPFPTELSDANGEHLATKGREFGTVTGRPRRCGWFDAVLTRQICSIAGVTSLGITKLDVLDGLPELKIGVGYELNGQHIEHLPSAAHEQKIAKPIYENFSGWTGTVASQRTIDGLPPQARAYISRIEQLCGIEISLISTSPRREDIVLLSNQILK